MNRHYRLILSAFGAGFLLLGSNVHLSAQSPVERSQPSLARAARTRTSPSGAKGEAMAAYGTLHDQASGQEMVGHALYVKLRAGYDGDPLIDLPGIAARAGLPVVTASRTPFATVQPDAAVARHMMTLSVARQARAEAARQDLLRIIEVYYSPDISPREAAARLERLPQVEYAEPIFMAELLGAPLPNDSLVQQQLSYLDAVKLPQAWEVWKGDTNMVIGIVDVAVDQTHPDLGPNIKENPGEAGPDGHGGLKQNNGIDDDHNGVVDDWRGANLTSDLDGSPPGDTRGNAHGTQVTGIAAAATNNVIGIAGAGYLCRFFPVKAAYADGSRYPAGIDGIGYCAARGFKVINCSFKTGYSRAVQDQIADWTATYDCAIVAGAGNDVGYGEVFPAGYDHVLGVGSLGVDPGETFFTGWGEQVDIATPSTGMTTDVTPAGDHIYSMAGPATSYGTPVVSGALALVRSKFPTLTADQAMAHLRLTADPIIPQPDYKNRLTGYGRLDAYRAVTTDPFSHPAIMIDSVWITDDGGNPVERIAVGGHGQLHVRLHNLLGNATNVKVKATLYVTDDRYVADDSAVIDIAGTAISTPSINTDEVKVLAGGIPFTMKAPTGDKIRVRFDITADDYTDYQYQRVLIYLPYMTAHTPNITMSITDMGRLGFEDYPVNSVGDGFRYQGAPFLYEGGLMIASDAAHVLSNVRGSNTAMQQQDFAPIEYPTQANNFTLTLSDSAGGDRKIGLEMRMRFVTVDTIPDAIGVELRTRNVSAGRIDSLRVAMFADWDLDSSSNGQGLDYAEAPGMAVPFYGRATSQSDFFLMHGVAATAPIPIFYAIDNRAEPILIYDSFTPEKKWITLSNGVGNRSVTATDASDISIVIGHTIPGFAAGAEDTTLFVIGVSALAREARDAMQLLARTQRGGVAGVDPEPNAMVSLLGVSQTNGVATIHVGRSGGDARLRLYDVAGRQVADLTPRLSRSGTSTILFDGSALPSGVYYVQLISSLGAESQSIVLAR